MSKQKLLSALTQGAWLINAEYFNTYAPLVAKFLNGEPVSFFDKIEKKNSKKSRPYAVSFSASTGLIAYSTYDEAPIGSIAVVPLKGVMMKEDNCGAPGTATLKARVNEAADHPNIKGTILYAQTGGGSVDGTSDFHDAILSAKSKKPIVCFTDNMLASAGVWAACGCDEIIAANKTTSIGSIGTACTIYDNTKALEDMGYKMIYVNAPTSPDKNQEYFQAVAGNIKPLQESLGKINDLFQTAVLTNRAGKINAKKTEEPMTGKMYLAQDALNIGLIDYIGDIAFAIERVNALSEEKFPNSNHNSNNYNMKIKEGWAAMIASLTTKFTGVKADDKITEEHAEFMNAELATLADTKKKLADAEAALVTVNTAKTKVETDLATATSTIGTLTTEKTALETENERLAKLKGIKSIVKKISNVEETDEVDANEFQMSGDKEIAELRAKAGL